MIRSMTGYGRGQAAGDHLEIDIEIKTVNHRYADISIRAPRSLAARETQLKKQVAVVLKRGKIDVYITQNSVSALSAKPVINAAMAIAYRDAFAQLSALEGVGGDIPLELLAAQPEVLVLEEVAIAEGELDRCLEQALNQALQAVVRMRETEGEATAADLRERIGVLEVLLNNVGARGEVVPLEWRDKLQERLNRLQGIESDPQRVAQELALFADRCDISEEITRFHSHLGQFAELLSGSEAVGRQMDFLVQELNREANTIGSKSNDAVLTGYVVGMKSELEKIREQVQNIE